VLEWPRTRSRSSVWCSKMPTRTTADHGHDALILIDLPMG
jgi:hypothetical protein